MREAHEKQRGVALIIALILVALAAILATKLSFDGWLERRRAIGVIAAEQALHFGMGAEALAADVLSQSKQNGAQQDTLAQPWAQPTQPLPITPRDDPEGEPIGTLQGAIEDMQGRFNLNNLGRMSDCRRPANRIRSRWSNSSGCWSRSVSSPSGPASRATGSMPTISPEVRTARRIRSIPAKPRPTAPATGP